MQLTLSPEAAERLERLAGRLRAADPRILLRLRKFGGCRGGAVWMGPGVPAPGDRPVDCTPPLAVPVVADPFTAGMLRKVRASLDDRGLCLTVEDSTCAVPQPVAGPGDAPVPRA